MRLPKLLGLTLWHSLVTVSIWGEESVIPDPLALFLLLICNPGLVVVRLNNFNRF